MDDTLESALFSLLAAEALRFPSLGEDGGCGEIISGGF